MSKSITEAVVIEKAAIDPNKKAIRLALFNPDGTSLAMGGFVEGQQVVSVPLDSGRRTAGIGSPGDRFMDGIAFDHLADEYWASNSPTHWWESHSSGDVLFRTLMLSSFSGEPTENTQWLFEYEFYKSGTKPLDTDTETIPNVTKTIDVSAYSFDDVITEDFVIPESDVDSSADGFYWRLTRQATSDTFAHDFYVLDAQFRWNAIGVPLS